MSNVSVHRAAHIVRRGPGRSKPGVRLSVVKSSRYHDVPQGVGVHAGWEYPCVVVWSFWLRYRDQAGQQRHVWLNLPGGCEVETRKCNELFVFDEEG